MIRFSAFLVVVAVGLLVAGVVTSKLLLVYIAIGVSGVALLALGVGAVVNWRELTGKPGTAHPGTAEPGTLEPSAQGPAPQAAVPEPVTSPAAAGAAPGGSGWPATVSSARSGPSRIGHLPVSEPPWARPAPAAASAAARRRPRRRLRARLTRRSPRPRSPRAARTRRAVSGSGATIRSRSHRLLPRASPLLLSGLPPGPQARPLRRPRSPRPSPARSAVASCDAGIRRRGVRASGLPQARRVGRACHVTSADPEARPVPRRTRAGRQARPVTGRPATWRATLGHGAAVG